MPNFTESSDAVLRSGRMRDDSFDDAVRLANDNRGKVYEETVADVETAEDYRKGLDRSVKYLNDKEKSGVCLDVSVIKEFTTHDDGSVTVKFSATARRTRAASNGSE